MLTYLAAYGPATRDNLHHWLTAGLSAGRRRVDGWVDALVGDRVAEIAVDGSSMLHLREHLAELAAADPARDVVLLPAYDQWVLGPGTADRRVVPAGLRLAVSRGANVLLLDGQVAATWKTDRDLLAVSWSAEGGRPPRPQIDAESARLSALLGRDLRTTVSVS